MSMPVQIGDEIYLNTTEACERLGVTRETLNNYVKSGRLQRYKQGVRRTSYYKQAELDKLLEFRKETE